MLLTCDIGNTNIKTGLFKENILTEFKVIKDISKLRSYINENKVTDLLVSSVVPRISEQFKSVINNQNINISFINHKTNLNLELDYKTPNRLGMDRICAAEGAFYLNKSVSEKLKKNDYIVVIDFGTATTVNVISGPGIFLGGMIAPGIETMLNSLTSNTAQLPMTPLSEYSGIIGKSTKECISSGIINSQVGLITRTLQPLQKSGKSEVFIYVTGGNYDKIKKYLPFKHKYEVALVLYGINAIYTKNH